MKLKDLLSNGQLNFPSIDLVVRKPITTFNFKNSGASRKAILEKYGDTDANEIFIMSDNLAVVKIEDKRDYVDLDLGIIPYEAYFKYNGYNTGRTEPDEEMAIEGELFMLFQELEDRMKMEVEVRRFDDNSLLSFDEIMNNFYEDYFDLVDDKDGNKLIYINFEKIAPILTRVNERIDIGSESIALEREYVFMDDNAMMVFTIEKDVEDAYYPHMYEYMNKKLIKNYKNIYSKFFKKQMESVTEIAEELNENVGKLIKTKAKLQELQENPLASLFKNATVTENGDIDISNSAVEEVEE